ncbi:uncharacterized protein [Asterias amurensis]|uniref:uncharacterized protein n=1 Tax=Asterias amurensis TaxID=7602 RepID=UPI003AB54154
MDSDLVRLPVSRGGIANESYDATQLRCDSNNNRNGSPAIIDDLLLYSPSTSSSDKDSQFSPENYQDEEFYGKLKVKVRKDGKKLVEKKRRQDLQQQYSNLRMMVPGLQDIEGRTPFSRNVILKNTFNYIEQLKTSVRSSLYLANELRREQEYSLRLERELLMWQRRVADLREKRKSNDMKPSMSGQGCMVNSMASSYSHS